MRCVSRPLPRGRTFSCTSAHRKRARYARVCQYWLAEMRAFGAHLQGSRTPRCYNCICTAVTANARHRRAFSTAPPSKSADCLPTVSASLKRARGTRVSSHRTGLHWGGCQTAFPGGWHPDATWWRTLCPKTRAHIARFQPWLHLFMPGFHCCVQCDVRLVSSEADVRRNVSEVTTTFMFGDGNARGVRAFHWALLTALVAGPVH